MARVRLFALSAVGRDRPGIVASVSSVLLDHQANIDDSQMAILRGHFAMTLIVELPDDADPDALTADLEQARTELELDAVALNEIEGGGPGSEPSHVVSVYGVDHPGIVHAVSAALAVAEISITDLDTRVLGDEANPLYVMVLELALGERLSTGELQTLLQGVADEQGIEITARELEADAL